MAENLSRRRLGRGLATLIGDIEAPAESDGAARTPPPDRTVPIELIRANSFNPRRQFNEEELTELAHSILRHGLIQPILVRPVQDSVAGIGYEIIAGERRWRAAQRAGIHEVPVIVREAEDRVALELAIIENVQRSDLNAVEEALGYQQLLDEHDYSQAELGQTLGKSRSHIANMLRLLKLPESVRKMIVSGDLSAGHARTLVTADNPELLALDIIRGGLSVRQAESLTQEADSRRRRAPGAESGSKSADLRAIERQMEQLLGLKVNLAHRANGSGKMTISYSSIDQLNGICRRLDII
jgi:ParB family transcriptional regulator, chromosome partitioning protein